MDTVRLNRRIADYLAATADDEALDYSPDGLDALSVTILNRRVQAELRSSRTPEPTAWMSMTERERAEIRPVRRRTPIGVLRLVNGVTYEATVIGATENEAA